MNNQTINLLPWRQAEFRRKSRDMLIKILIFAFIVLFLLFIIQFLQQQTETASAQQIQALQQEKQQLNETQQKVTALRQQLQGAAHLPEADRQHIKQFLALLTALPLSQGELQSAECNAQQIRLLGKVATQSEFEQLDQFLQQQPWVSQVTLTQLQPQPNGDLHFDYQLSLGERR